MRQPLVDDFNITHEQAAQRLTNIWQAQNLVESQEWDLQQKENDEANRLGQEWHQKQEEECRHLLEEEQELARQEEQKKNRNKFLLYNKVPISSAIPKLPSALTVHKIKKGDYVEVYHFTNKGLAKVEVSSRSLNDDAFALTKDNNSHHSFIPIAAAKAKETIIPDKDHMWAEIDEAAPRLLLAMKENGWDKERVQSHLQFLMALSAHKFRHDADGYGMCALIVYQDIVRRRWHNLLSTMQLCDLAPIDKGMIKEIHDKLLYKANKTLKDEAMQASCLFPPQADYELTIHDIYCFYHHHYPRLHTIYLPPHTPWTGQFTWSHLFDSYLGTGDGEKNSLYWITIE
ncbi:hypothetical protein PAXRUDRAFT_21293 [Paxillus rubicundulus Ve08.2h10]|uniref:Uncharacterized protein n=1 Tax=Paxillus rubicundulus Ve08.2h10 TaxID=930991 RepID=A0A0D0BN95_9AGAM|nr:hypothetical protein PAXRUDRAFT_21293 [Paxillus rubicundulus Ve08.2h10]